MKVQQLLEAKTAVKIPTGLPEELVSAIKSVPGVSKVSKNVEGIKVSLNHSNGYMDYHYVLSKDGDLRVTWNGYQSPGGDKILVKKDEKKALETLIKKIKTQAKAQKNSLPSVEAVLNRLRKVNADIEADKGSKEQRTALTKAADLEYAIFAEFEDDGMTEKLAKDFAVKVVELAKKQGVKY